MIPLEQQCAIRVMQVEQLMAFMATSDERRDNEANQERARLLWLEVVRLSTLIASEA